MSVAKELLHLNIADYIIVGVVLISTLISLIRGFLKEFISLMVWILGFWVAIKFYQMFAAILEPYVANAAIRQIASFTLIFLLVLILGALFNYLFSFIIIKSGLSGTDRLLGMVFGCTRGVLLVAVVLLLIASTSFVEESWWQKSSLIPHFQVLLDWLKAFLPEKMTSIVGIVK
ncbi:MAG: CvpA family protein [Gammaproteobacteria bacterium]|nr:CvpA family protein [Gammaproteobacteria bacterium]